MKRKVLVAVSLLSGSILLLLVLTWFTGNNNGKSSNKSEATVPVIRYEFEIPVDSFDHEILRIQPNQFLADLLLARGVDYPTIDRLAKTSKPIFDVARLKAGNRCHLFFDTDSLARLRYFVYEIDQASYLVYTFGDSLMIRKGQKEITFNEAVVKGTILSSPWNAMLDLNASTNLAIELENIYAWTIDFFSLNKGDKFEIYHENKYVDTTYIGIGKVFATKMEHGGKDLFAFLFEQDGIESYYNEHGESLRRSFLKAPLKSYRISSRYSNSRMHPIMRIRRPHRGVDYAAPQGTPVFAIGDGTVEKVSYDQASGNYIKIKHNSLYTSGYMHLMKRPNYSVGQYVRQEAIIGYVGQTGYATGPHLDFRIWKNGQPVDPLRIEAPPVEPVRKELRPVFDSIVKGYREKLDQQQGINQLTTESETL